MFLIQPAIYYKRACVIIFQSSLNFIDVTCQWVLASYSKHFSCPATVTQKHNRCKLCSTKKKKKKKKRKEAQNGVKFSIQ